jgi:hypothetical protein
MIACQDNLSFMRSLKGAAELAADLVAQLKQPTFLEDI